MFKNIKCLAAIAACQLFIAAEAHALFITSPIGLVGASNTVTFDGSGFAQNTAISNQFASQGVSFSPNVFLQPSSQCGSCIGFSNDFVANFTFNPTVIGSSDIVLSFSGIVSEAAFAITDQNALWTFEARLGSTVVDSGSLVIPFNPGAGFVGFTGIQFDNIHFFAAGTTAMGLDTVQFTAAVPEPATLALLALGFAGFGLRRRRSII